MDAQGSESKLKKCVNALNEQRKGQILKINAIMNMIVDVIKDNLTIGKVFNTRILKSQPRDQNPKAKEHVVTISNEA